MRRTLSVIGGMALSAVATGCGGGQHFANLPRPPAPLNLTVYLGARAVTVSPTTLGAGPVVFIVTNAAPHVESLQVQATGSSQPLADTGPISPQETATVKVDLRPGDYLVGAGGSGGQSDAALATPSTSITPASLHIGAARPSAKNLLLQP